MTVGHLHYYFDMLLWNVLTTGWIDFLSFFLFFVFYFKNSSLYFLTIIIIIIIINNNQLAVLDSDFLLQFFCLFGCEIWRFGASKEQCWFKEWQNQMQLRDVQKLNWKKFVSFLLLLLKRT